jgi:hypothetical protein
MNLTWRHKAVLIGILRDQQAIAAQDFHGGDNMPYMQRGNYRLRIRRAEAGYVPVNVEGWLGAPPSNSETVMFHRAQVQLATMGLIERHSMAGGRRTTHLQLTDAGFRIAEGLLAEEAPIDTGEPLDLADLDLSSLVAELETDAPAAP